MSLHQLLPSSPPTDPEGGSAGDEEDEHGGNDDDEESTASGIVGLRMRLTADRSPEEAVPPDEPPLGGEDPSEALVAWTRVGAVWLAHGLALTAAVLSAAWVRWWLGGLSWKRGESKQVFNWHPLLMVLAFFGQTVAALSFRRLGHDGGRMARSNAKRLHVAAWSGSAACMGGGLVAVFRSHNDPVSGYIANLYSFHSWIGILVVVLYAFQLVAGLWAFWFRHTSARLSPRTKVQLLAVHTHLGPAIYAGTSLAILLGIQEKEGFLGCAYRVEGGPDLRPWEHLSDIPSTCRVGHALGLLVVAATAAASLALLRRLS